jgi:hypothetical protein
MDHLFWFAAGVKRVQSIRIGDLSFVAGVMSTDAAIPSLSWPFIYSSLRQLPPDFICAHQVRRAGRLGRANWVREIAHTSETESAGIGFAVESGLLFAVKLSEQIRASGKRMIAPLSDTGLSCEILFGDAHAPVSWVTSLLAIREFSANLRPAEKLQRLTELSP